MESTSLCSISKLFTEMVFRIPDYQRGYAWTELQVRDFWNDVFYLEPGLKHYTGVLTLEDVPAETHAKWDDDAWIIQHRSYKPTYIVDGQQRLTTAIILIYEIIRKTTSGQLNFTPVDDIKRKFIYDSKPGSVSRSYLFGYEKDNPSYNFLKNKIFEEDLLTSEIPHETIYTRNLKFASSYFREQLEKVGSFTEIERIYKSLTQDLRFNIYYISSQEIDVQVAFETMNNRGRPLTSLELLKNRLIYLVSKLTIDDHEKTALRKQINDCWKCIYHELGSPIGSPLDDEDFLYYHYYLSHCPKTTFVRRYYTNAGELTEDQQKEVTRLITFERDSRRTYKDVLLNEIFKSDNEKNKDKTYSEEKKSQIKKYVDELRESVRLWRGIHDPGELTKEYGPSLSISIDKLLKMEYFSRVLVVALFRSSKDRSKISKALQLMERYAFAESLSFRDGYRAIRGFYCDADALALYLRDGVLNIDGVINEYETRFADLHTKKNEYIQMVSYRFSRYGFYTWDTLRYFLFEYEQSLQGVDKQYREKLIWSKFIERRDDFATIEHIYPQKPKKGEWSAAYNKFTPRQREILKNSLGNLLPLSQAKNSSLGNLPFARKVNGDEGGNREYVGYRYGCLSENEVAAKSDWTPVDILERGLRLLDFMEERWDLPRIKRDEKIKILGLEFIK